MVSLDVWPGRGSYSPGSTVALQVSLRASAPLKGRLRLSIHHLARRIAVLERGVEVASGENELAIEWSPPGDSPRGYGAEAVLEGEAGEKLAAASTAFDVLPSWTAFPRYGFLTDFRPGRPGIEAALELLARYHINGLQFYDWQHRHDHLVAPAEVYDDPLGRRQSLATVRRLIGAAHDRGMAAMAYLAVYAASVGFWEAHPEWALYDSDGKPIPFGDRFLGLMNPAPGGGWERHLAAQGERAIDALGFDGLHVDQYGEPRQGFSAQGDPVDLPCAFQSFVDECKRRRPGLAVVFNCIDGWPGEMVGGPGQDFAYMELWPRRPAYRELHALLADARRRLARKPLVVAQYIPAERPEAILQVDALLAAWGGTRIELGEAGRLLTDAYFPNHTPLPRPLAAALRRHYDFVVRYGDLIGPAAMHETSAPVHAPAEVWVVPRRAAGWQAFALVNFTGIEGERWDQAHPAPAPLGPFIVDVPVEPPLRGVWWASPDEDDPGMHPLEHTLDAGRARITVPRLKRWGIVACETGGTER